MFHDLFGHTRNEEKSLKDILPDELPILPLRNLVALPMAVIPLAVGIPRSSN